jgi:hypothetical protein
MTMSFGGGHVRMGALREETLFVVMVALTTGTRKFMWILTLKIARWFDEGDNFSSVCMRCSLRVY